MKKECLILSALISTASAFSQHKAPNIIFILCDDMGYGDLGCYGQKLINTPHIDQMAAEGMRFTQAYAGSPVSAPSRATLMTGQHSGHTHVRGNKEYWPQSAVVTYGENQDYAVVGQEPYDSAHVILPEVMKKNGYTTGMFGKWAGGYEGSWSTPDKRGVDEFYGYICQFQAHLYYPNFLNRYSRSKGDKEVKRIVLEENIKYPMFGDDYFKRPQYSADLIHQEALKWLDAQTGEQPFCGIFTYTLPHAELARPTPYVTLKGMLSLGNWRWDNNATAYFYNSATQPLANITTGAVASGVGAPDHLKFTLNQDGIHVGGSAQTTAAIGGDVKLLKMLHIGADYTYYARLYADYSLPTYGGGGELTLKEPWRVPAAGQLDLNARYDFNIGSCRASIFGVVKNVLNYEYIQDAFYDGTNNGWKDAYRVFYAFGRTFSVKLKIAF